MFEREPDSRQSIPPVSRRSSPHGDAKDIRSIWAVAVVLCLASAIPVAGHYVRSAESSAATMAASLQEETALEQTDTVPVAVAKAPAEHGSGAVVPASAIARIDGQSIVFVVDDAVKLLVATPVDLGAEVAGMRRILSGLTPGQIVVAEASPPLQRMLAQR